MSNSIESSSSSSSSSTPQWKYDVFLSFRGEDTRKNFTDHLYTALDEKGIITFRDDEELERGKQISSDLLQSIEESRFSIIILSKNYASSKWCLDELAKIVECAKREHTTAFPVFHYVDPSDVRKQTGDFKKHFDKHEDEFKENKQRVVKWRDALSFVANLSGWHLQNRHEAELIQEIVKEIWRRLNQTFSSLSREFIGIDYRVKELIEHLEIGGLDDNVGIIGVCGMGGIGKTTIARVVYDELSSQYQGCSFLANVREVSEKKGLVHLQEQLLYKILKVSSLNIQHVHEGINLIRRRLCRKKVLLVLDDVDQVEQLDSLAGNWFGSGSRIIITTRDEHLLVSHGIKNVYKVKGLNHDESVRLLHSKAFKHKQLTDDYVELLNHVVTYANGLPLALEVLGSLLCDRSVEEWKSVVDRLQRVPDEKILKVLRVSYDGLNKMEKEIFLDIACFFKGKHKDRIMKILDGCGFAPNIGINCLVEKSLITIQKGYVVWMHDLLQEMGWEIVREKHPTQPGKWSRLWLSKDIYDVLKNNRGTEAVECIILDRPKPGITHLNSKSFSTMYNLRLLKISQVHLSDDFEYLSSKLRFLEWPGYPLNSLPANFESEELLKLDMRNSCIEYLWNGIKVFQKLKTIKLSHSHNLIKTPDFTEVPNLEKLDLEGCTSLLEVHESVVTLERLVVLNLKDCKNLVKFPSNVCGLKSLKIFNLDGCSKLDNLPQNLGEVECLEELDISGTAIRKVPASIVTLNNLKRLSARGCGYNENLPKSWSSLLYSFWLPKRNSESMCLQLPPLAGLCSLTKLDLSNCNFSEGPNFKDLGNLSLLEELNLSRNNFASLPESIKQLSKLQVLVLDGCKKLQSLPELPPEIVIVGVRNCSALETLTTALERSSAAEMYLHFVNCFKLVENEEKEKSLAVMLLKQWRQRVTDYTHRFDTLLPGSVIPEWFSHRSDTNEVTIPLPPNWLSDDKFMGFVVCAVFAKGYTNMFEFQIKADYDDSPLYGLPIHTTLESDHLSLTYLSREFCEEEIERLSDSRTIGVRFGYESGWKNTLVKGCGMCLLYKQDLEYFDDVHPNFQELPVAAADSNAIIRKTSFFDSRNGFIFLEKYFQPERV